MMKAIFLDRDGVITRSKIKDGRPYAPTRLVDFEILPDVKNALQRLRQAGFINLIVTNQPDITTGKQSLVVLEMMHERLLKELAIDGIKVCIHVDSDKCRCRKPMPGMLMDFAKEWGIDLARSWMVGDRWRDIGAGLAAGCKCCFIDYGYNEQRPTKPYFAAKSLSHASEIIFKHQNIHGESIICPR